MSCEERNKLKRYWVQQAITCSMQGRWEDAIEANRTILSLCPDDAESYNRLGKAYMEMGRYTEAQQAYEQTLRLDPINSIARKNLQRLQSLMQSSPAQVESPPVRPPEVARIQPEIFIAETGKTGITTLNPVDSPTALSRLSTGSPLRLVIANHSLLVENQWGELVGSIEPKLGQRLIHLMQGGNQYAAAVASIDDQAIRIVLREIYQDPRQAGKVSFPTRVDASASFRPYIKDVLLKYEDEEEGDDSDSAPEGEGASDEEGEEVEESEVYEEDVNGG